MAERIHLPAGHVLTVSADASSSGSVRRLAPSGDGTLYAPETVAASASAAVGPFSESRSYEIASDSGVLTRSTALAGVTGEGAAVHAESPTITSATLAAPLITLPIATGSANGALTISPGVVKITKAGVLAATLAAPTAAQEGQAITIVSRSNNAHTITATGLIDDGVTGGPKNLATFAAFCGASITLMPIDEKWNVVSLNAVTIS